MTLSVLIAARNEMFLARTVEDVLAHKSPNTEVIVVLDGDWPAPALPARADLLTIRTPRPIGQRAAVNLAARISHADFVMKLDAHCGVDRHFDRKLIDAQAALGAGVIQVPSQWNLQAFEWRCRNCDFLRDQGPTPETCGCAAPDLYRDIVWRRRTLTETWRFDEELKFGYWREWKARMEAAAGLARLDFFETMSCLGACWFLPRELYWHLGGLDEAHGSWGQMGTELACKAWLSGGRLITNRRTWFSHMFRTQGGDFGFPYKVTTRDVERARAHSHALWREGRWPLATHNLRWLVSRFWPVPGWTEDAYQKLAA